MSEVLTAQSRSFFFDALKKNVFTALALLLLSSPAAHAVNITVNAASAVTTINDEVFGQNYAVYDSSAKPSDANYAAYTAGVSAMGTNQIRYPGGGYTDMMNWSSITCQYNWMPTLQESITFATACGARLQPCVNFSGQWCGSTYTHAQAVSLAAAWVTYMNVSPKAMPTTFWEVGNEQFVSGEPGFVGDTTAGGTTYGNQYVDFYTAMKAVDPNIKVGAQVQYDHSAFTNGVLAAIKAKGVTMDFCISHCYPYYCSSSGACETTAVDSQLVGSSVDLGANAATSIRNMLSSNGFPTTVPLWMSEFRSTVDEEKAIEWVDAMFVAQFLLKMGETGWRGANIWDIKNGYNSTYISDYGLLASGTNTVGGVSWTENKPHVSWYVYPFLSKVFGRNLVSCSSSAATVRSWASKDASGNLTVFMVNNDFSNQQAATISLSGFSPGATGNIWTLVPSGQTKGGATTPIQDLCSVSVNGTVNPAVSAIPGTGNSITTGASIPVTLPAASMVLVKILNANSTPIPTPTRTMTPTPTSTACIILLNGCNSAAENGTWSGANASRGFVTSCPVTNALPSEGSACMAVTVTTGAAWNGAMFNLDNFTPSSFAGVSQLKVDLYVPAAMVTVQSWQSLGLSANAYSGATTVWSGQISSTTPALVTGFQTLTFNLDFPATIKSNWTLMSLIFAYNASTASTGTMYVDNLRLVNPCGIPTPTPTQVICAAMLNNCESLTENGTWDGANATRSIVTAATGAPAGFPTQGSACMRALVNTWNQYNTGLFNLSGFTPSDFYGTTRIAMDIYVDATLLGSGYNQLLMFADSAPSSLFFQGISSTAPTLVAGKNSVTFTVDYQPPGGGPVTLTSNNAISKLSFVYNTSATTGTGSFYVDSIQLLRDGCIATRTPTRTFTPSPTLTMTRTFTMTPTPTPTPTSANTSTYTATPTPTATRTSTPTSTPTLTLTATRTNTSTATPTSTATSANTATFTSTMTASRTATPSPTASGTNTSAATATPTRTSTVTATPSATASRTHTATSTPTGTNTGTSTYTPTWTSTGQPTATVTNSRTSTPTSTVTSTPSTTASRTPTATSTPTGTNTSTATATPTRTSTVTSTPSATASRTHTATSTPTGTNTGTSTHTPTWTSTGQATATVTNSNTSTSTPTNTSSRTVTPTNTASATNTPTWTSTFSATATPTSSRTATPTVTSTSTMTSTWTISFTPTWSVTGTQPPTGTFTVTSTPTSTPTPTNTWTATFTSTVTATPTNTLSVATSTNTPTRTSTMTATPSATASRTHTATSTPTGTNTDTATYTPTWTSTGQPTATVTNSSTVTSTPSATASPTHTSTSTPTGTNTSSRTATPTATSTRTATVTATPTATWTFTFTPTSTSTATWTPTWTWTPTPTFTPTWTPTWTATSTATSTGTATATSTATTTGPCGKVAVSAPYPNPVTVGRTVRFDLAAACSTQVHWKVVTAAYRKVLETTVATRGATTSVAWDLKDAKGRSVAPGLYYLVVTPEGQDQEVRSVLVLP